MSCDFLGINPKNYCASLNDLAWLSNRRNQCSQRSVAQCNTLLRRRRRRRNITVDKDNVYYYYHHHHHHHHYSKFIFKVNWLLLHTAPHSVFKILVFHPQ
jgi:hypothetical protein